ncbi:hypothetical protein ACFXDE_20985 [Kitasatospora sp. NPDC059408]|uniref:hypothetical protein n=1 Tax=Kitasatospora sp. NPDC059408 TaxID=3346823 RepID=UPI003699C354
MNTRDQYEALQVQLGDHAAMTGAKAYATEDDSPSTSPHVLAQRLARHSVHHGATVTPEAGGAVTVEWPRPGRTVRVVWRPVIRAQWVNLAEEMPGWTADSRAYGKGAEDASRMRGWRLSRAGYRAWAEAVGLSGDDGEWFAYATGHTDWWISHEGR